MKVDSLRPLPETRLEFSLSTWKFLPNALGCYVLTNYFNDILYIGLAKNISGRIRQHLANPAKTNQTEFGKAFFVYFIKVNDEFDLNRVERGWINMYELEVGKLPPLNSIHSPL